jgi:adenylate/nucleoside-diphosphate kinase
LLVVQYKDNKFQFASEYKLQKFLMTPGRYNKTELPVKMPPHEEPVSLFALQASDDSTTFIEQALGSIVTRGLREVSENRLKYPSISVKETMLKLFALFLKAENSANTSYMGEKYRSRMKSFIERCEMAEELDDLATERVEKLANKKWPDFKENYCKELGQKYDAALMQSLQEVQNGFCTYMK